MEYIFEYYLVVYDDMWSMHGCRIEGCDSFFLDDILLRGWQAGGKSFFVCTTVGLWRSV